MGTERPSEWEGYCGTCGWTWRYDNRQAVVLACRQHRQMGDDHCPTIHVAATVKPPRNRVELPGQGELW